MLHFVTKRYYNTSVLLLGNLPKWSIGGSFVLQSCKVQTNICYTTIAKLQSSTSWYTRVEKPRACSCTYTYNVVPTRGPCPPPSLIANPLILLGLLYYNKPLELH